MTTRYEQVKYDRRITQKTPSVTWKVWGWDIWKEVEKAIRDRKRKMLVAIATGTP
jgi:hypothetical protein